MTDRNSTNMNMARAILPPSSDESAVASATRGVKHINSSKIVVVKDKKYRIQCNSLGQIEKYDNVTQQ